MADYAFLTTWKLDAPIDVVWGAISKPDQWPAWWEKLSVEHLNPGITGLGSARRFTLQAPFGYKLSFEMRQTVHEPPHSTGGEASGDLAGSGLWEISEADQGTLVQYTWRVRTTKAWMNWLAPLARPLFARNHALAMGRAGEGLARHLGVALLAQSHQVL